MNLDELMARAGQIRLLVLDVDGTLTDGGVYIDANGLQSRRFNIKDGMGITLLQRQGVEVAFLSHSSSSTILGERARMLGIQRVYAGKEPKREVLGRWLAEMEISMEQVAYVGDDVNDLEILREAGLSACPADAHERVLPHVHIVLARKGGDGCVRELIDHYLLTAG